MELKQGIRSALQVDPVRAEPLIPLRSGSLNKTSRLAKIADVRTYFRYTLKKDSDLMNRVQFNDQITADCYAAHTQRKVGDPAVDDAELLSDTKTWNGFTVLPVYNIASYIYDFGNRPFWYTFRFDPGTVVFPNRMLQVLSSIEITPSAFEEIDVQGVPYYDGIFAISTDRKTYGVSNVTTFIPVGFVAKELAVISSQVEIVHADLVDQGTATITKGGCYIY
ncbi:hypothetical protein SPFM12_00028 [Salmonella phage SPFM12]|nr:hypothetical protein SPFM12_00028 [Salmonella phage SPFM12]